MNPLESLTQIERLGFIEECIGLKITANGPPQTFAGELCEILDKDKNWVTYAEVIGFQQGKVYLMPFSDARICMGYSVRATGDSIKIPVGFGLLGQVIDALGRPLIRQKHFRAETSVAGSREKISPLRRAPVTERLFTGIHAIDALLPLGKGQRSGLFAGSGVGKSVLLNMMAGNIHSDINILAFIGERGREVQEFIEKMDEATRLKTVIIAACSDEPALMRRQAAYTATAVAEYFCSQNKQVMLFMDSITRFAMAQREIGLSLGEPPTARGYTPTVFSLLPGIVERAGNFTDSGSITALYTVLVEGDDFNEPIADTMRSLLDGHIILSRNLASQGHYPAIDILQSISRLALKLTSAEEQLCIKKVIASLSLYHQNKDLIELGAWQPGANPALDKAVQHFEPLKALLVQNVDESRPFEELISCFMEVIS